MLYFVSPSLLFTIKIKTTCSRFVTSFREKRAVFLLSITRIFIVYI